MEDHHHHRRSILDTNVISDTELEMYGTFTPDDDYIITSNTATTTQSTQSLSRERSTSNPFELETSDEINRKNDRLSSAINSTITDSRFEPGGQQKSNTLQQFDKMFIDLPWNDNVYTIGEEEEIQESNSIDDPILPQRMSQLSTTTTNEKESTMKDMKAEIAKIPDYLTKQNKSFHEMIHHVHSTIRTAITINIEELRKIAIVIYKIMVIQTYHLLWRAYLKSGLGELMIPSKESPSAYSTTISVWPKEMKKLIQLSNNTNENENEIYLNFINKHLHELDHQLKQNQIELNIKANNVVGYTSTIQKIIETYIEQHLSSFRMKIEHQIELIHYDYHIRALKVEYIRHNPNEYQLKVMKHICRSKYEQETTEQEYNLLKQQITYYNSPSQSFECSPIAQSILIGSVQNTDIRQQLFNQYKEIAMRSRANLFHINMKSAEEQRDEYKKKYQDSVNKVWSDDRSPDGNQKIPPIMIHLIDERHQKISERIKCIYKFKTQSTLS